ncbi:PAS domain-containing protein [Pyxidicoccus fallax]|uniref:histidine kinase n=1 Tax=Pyxidicoccus fallax TaxID=394095 RepID=A0A848LS73_9BACT|nr:ATP-binding protein [Pyxidicoccus fallax]NMO20808.1 PAS domain-containing protein [Pyxidicoccus fallax]NPC81759.1 PAS domain-containing protein [Pyxidicoccus fallax]
MTTASTFLLFVMGVLVASLVAGRGAGWITTLVTAALSYAFLRGGPGTPPPGALVEMLLFVGVGGLAATLGAHSRRAPQSTLSNAESPLVSALLQASGDATVITDAQGVVRHVNPVAGRLFAGAAAPAEGRPLGQVLHLLRTAHRESVAPSLSPVVAERIPAAEPLRPSSHGESTRSDVERGAAPVLGARGEMDESAVPVMGAEGELLGAVTVLRDASERRRLERAHAESLAREHAALAEAQAQRERMESLFLQAPVAIAVFRGPDHRCELLNPHALELIDAPSSAIGRPLRDVMPDINAGLLRLIDDVFQTGVPFSGREVPMLLEPRHEAGGVGGLGRYFDLTWQPWRAADGSIQGVMAVAVEVTGLVNARHNAEVLAQEAQEALRTREEFLSIASHELKTPITSLQLQLDLLLRSVPQDGSNDVTRSNVRKRVEAAKRPVARLHQLVSTLLDVSRIRAGRMEVRQEPVDLSALVQDLVARAQEDAANARCPLHMEVEGPIVGQWDRLRLEQVITNLLSNAFKYGAQQPVEVRVTREDDHARLTVRDHGIGIAPEDHERIFQRFERAVSDRHYGGFGLGLWIVRQILESLHGDIHVRSEPGQGATFIVRLPLEPATSAVA